MKKLYKTLTTILKSLVFYSAFSMDYEVAGLMVLGFAATYLFTIASFETGFYLLENHTQK